MKTIQVDLKNDPYKIVVGYNSLSTFGQKIKPLKLGEDAIIITSPVIKKFHGKVLVDSLKRSGFTVKEFVVPDGEQSKSAQVAIDLMEKIARYDVLKKVFVVAFGGGVIGDLAGYVAAAYKRGVPYVQVPTTFLAQIDSAIGGKVAIDLSVGKNLVGAFYQPKLVFSDVSVLKSLDDRQIRNGFAEAIKYGIIDDPDLFDYIQKNYNKVFTGSRTALMHIVTQCSQIKAKVVLADEKETKGIRTILNFGHTVGHAIEAAGNFSMYDHGQAVAIGMRIATEISFELKLVSKKTVDRINALIDAVGLPVRCSNLTLKKIMKLMQHDKKFISGKNRFVLVQKIGKVKVLEDIPMAVIEAATKSHMD